MTTIITKDQTKVYFLLHLLSHLVVVPLQATVPEDPNIDEAGNIDINNQANIKDN